MYSQYPFQSNFITVDSHRLHYVDQGVGPVVIMAHGNPTWSYYYRNLISLLSKSHRVIALDHLGCGLSDKPQDYSYTLKNHISNLESLVDQLSIEDFSLVVHDWGGAIGFGLAGRRPDHVQKIVVLNTAAYRSSRIPFRIQICRWPVIGPLIVRGLNGFAGPAVHMAVTKKMKREVVDGFLGPYDSWQNRVAINAFVRDIPLAEDHPSYSTLVEVEENLQNLADVPLLICWGGRDFCFNDHFYEEWRNRFPQAQCHYFPDGGHYILEDEFSAVADLVENFFGGGEEQQ
ncbi:MAG: alpha/beta fold hydrolase [Thermodesulfobacteriota bacterium]